MRNIAFTLILCMGALAGRTSAASVSLSPIDGSITGIAGGTTGWGFEANNDSPFQWISFAESFLVFETNPALGSYVDLIGSQGGPVNFELSPNTPWTQAFSLADGTGIGQFTIDPTAVVGASDSGQIRVVWEAFDGDPATCNCSPTEFSVDLPFQVTVADAPEPGAMWLIAGGLLLLLASRVRVRVCTRCVLPALLCLGWPLAGQQVSDFEIIESASCGAPGNKSCANLTCTQPSANQIRSDPYTALVYCSLGSYQCTAIRPIIPSPFDITFLIGTDLHLHNGWDITDRAHFLHVKAMNALPNLGMKWSQSGAGMDNIPIGTPIALLTTGDDTHGGTPTDQGGLRLLYEPGMMPDSIRYPFLPGLGNHDIGNDCEFDSCARSMFDYVATAAGCVANSIDPASHSYSWDWGPVHFVQLNASALDTGLGKDGFGNKFTHPSAMLWLANDLTAAVGNSGRPVVLLQHYGWDSGSTDPYSACDSSHSGCDCSETPQYCTSDNYWWTRQQRQTFMDLIEPYNVVGIFTGHGHIPGMHATNAGSKTGKTFDNFTGGNGGIGGYGHFFGIRMTERYLDVVPFQWQQSVNGGAPQMVEIGDDTAANSSFFTFTSGDHFYNRVAGCRKWMGPPPIPVPEALVTIDPQNPNRVIVTNTSGAILNGPFALRFSLAQDDVLNSVSFVASCVNGPVYQELGVNSLGRGQQASVVLSHTGSAPYSASSFTVVTLGGDSFTATPGTLTLTSAPQAISISTVFNRPNVPFTFDVDQSWVHISASSSQTPATLNVSVDGSATQFTRNAVIKIHPTDPNYRDASIQVDLAKTPVTLQSNLNDPITVDGASVGVPHTFNWYPGERHSLNATDGSPSAGTADRFQAWSDGGAQSHNITIPVLPPGFGQSFTANYQRYYQVGATVNPSNGGQVNFTPSSPDGFYLPGSSLHVSVSPAASFVLSVFGGSTVAPPFDTTVQGPLNYSATFIPVGSYSITTSLGASGSETVDGKSYSGPATVTWTAQTHHTFSVPPIVGGVPGVQDVFTGWSDGVMSASRTVVAGSVTTYTAQYKRQYFVTTSVSPAGSGTITTAGQWYDDQAAITFTATAASGFSFGNFSGDLSGSQNPQTLIITKSENVVANFTPGTPVLSATPGPRNDSDKNTSVFTLVLSNTGPGGAADVQIDRITPKTVIGSDSPTILTCPASGASASSSSPATCLPLPFGTILPGQSASQALQFSWPQTATRVAFTVHFTANGGSYQGQSVINVFR